ncbi:bifunctional adenosylcobinamide kinase/adenosylcobinamide-phosphate guanylyltransferase [Yoonia sp.]|uniref:bifunctional adenosylcobinamide kinase/adenosylcobinamide-phosphate guanylyltransferase n=1 Tax=Yoonia sp. TaxID=2212373 RepID=UPI002FD909BF
MTLPRLSLVLGGAASGKSAFAEGLVKSGPARPTYIATSQVHDDEMAAKVAAHRAMRGEDWTTIEEPLDIAAALTTAPADAPVLIDCATLWLTNVILGEHDLDAAQRDFLAAIAAAGRPVVVVSNETGQGIVPENALARRFRNAQGRLNQAIAAQADLVVVVMAGLPMVLKGKLS